MTRDKLLKGVLCLVLLGMVLLLLQTGGGCGW